MKRSEMVAYLEETLNGDLPEQYQFNADTFLCNIEVAYGMKPPGIPVKLLRPADFKWGSCCTMRCVCKDCDPEFIVYEWEQE